MSPRSRCGSRTSGGRRHEPTSGKGRGLAGETWFAPCDRAAGEGVVGMSDLEQVLKLARAATTALERSRQRIDDLNVYPVPDGDTGTNMTMTARAVVEELDQTHTDERLALIKEVTRAALMGARGNSGVILSQIIRGAAEPLGTNGS